MGAPHTAAGVTIPNVGPDTLVDVDLDLPDRRDGKVRVSYALGDSHRLFVTTDRLSAFDRVIATVEHKGQVLNELAAWWFDTTSDLVANHVVAVPDPNVLVARAAAPLPVEVVVRGYITGVTSTSLWHQYASGDRRIYGYDFPDGLTKNTALPEPIVTPTTKGVGAVHDMPLSCADVVESGLVDADRWAATVDAALAVFASGQDIAARAGLILADTKYEFGVAPDGELLLIDEVHTPDSSRYWVADTYLERLGAGEEPESLDKEVVRRALADAGYRGDGPPPELEPAVWAATTERYVDAFQRLTGRPFRPADRPAAERIAARLPDIIQEYA